MRAIGSSLAAVRRGALCAQWLEMEMRAPVMVRQGGQEVLRQLPPGFRFRPTDEELVLQYLRRKALDLPLPAAVIPDVHNLYSLDPWDIPGASEGEKYFFALRPAAGSGGKSGGRSTTTASGCWKPASGGRDRPVVVSRCGRNHLVGVKKSMAFVPRRSRGKGRKTTSPAAPVQVGWVMHEYRLALPHQHKNGCCLGETGTEEWVVCRIFKKDRSSSSSYSSRRETLGGHGTDEHRTMSIQQSLSSPASSSSCVTSGGSPDLQEEVSS